MKITVAIARDIEANVWYVVESSLPGLNIEAESMDKLFAQLPLAIQDLLEAGNGGSGQVNVPFELIARSQTDARV